MKSLFNLNQKQTKKAAKQVEESICNILRTASDERTSEAVTMKALDTLGHAMQANISHCTFYGDGR